MATCSISGNIPEEPVASKTGYIFEKRLILKHLEIHGTCPITHQPLTPDDLITLATVNPIVQPRPPSATSFPHLLNLLQNEYDAMLLETFTLKQQHERLKSDLTKALYQQDAANRVIARLYKENELLKVTLQNADERVVIQASRVATAGNTTVGSASSSTTTMNDEAGHSDDRAAVSAIVVQSAAILAGKANRPPSLKLRKQTHVASGPFSGATYSPTLELDFSASGKMCPIVETNAIFQTNHDPAAAATDTSSPEIVFSALETGVVVVSQYTRASEGSPASTRVLVNLPVASDNTLQTETRRPAITSLVVSHFSSSTLPWALNQALPPNANPSEYVSFIVLCDRDRVIKAYLCPISELAQVASWKCFMTIPIPSNSPNKQIVLHPSNQLLFLLQNDSTVRIFSTASPTSPVELVTLPQSDVITAISNHPDGKMLFLTTKSRSLLSLNLLDWQLSALVRSEDNVAPLDGCVISENGYQALTWTNNKEYTAWDLRRPDQTPAPVSCPGLSDAVFDPTGAFYALVTSDAIQFVNAKDHKTICVTSIPAQVTAGGVLTASFQNYNHAVVIASQNKLGFIEPLPDSA